MELVIFDVETTGLTPGQDEIIEIGAAHILDGEVIATFQELIRIDGEVPLEIRELTGITDELLQDAEPLSTVLPRFLTFIAGKPVAGYNVAFDMAFLTSACDAEGYELPVSVDALDVLELTRIILPSQRDYRLKDIAEHFSVLVTEAHRALADVLTTASVLQKLETLSEELPYATLQQLARLAGMFSPETSRFFEARAAKRFLVAGTTLNESTESIHQLVFSAQSRPLGDSQEKPGSTADEDGAEALHIQALRYLAGDSPLKDALSSFEIRKGQQEMVSAVAQALEGDQHLIAEAGTGTGKSLAYLIPSVLYALQNKERVVVSTHTIALQDQIHDRDYPTLQKIIPEKFNLAVFKGRTHYVCMRKLYQEIQGAGFATSREELVAYAGLLVWLVSTPEGNREELQGRSALGEIWPRIQSETETCINKRCPFFKPCYYFRARTRAYEADVIVTNHSLVFSDLKADHRVLPRYDKLVLDEAHHLEEVATSHLGEDVALNQMAALFGRLSRENAKQGILPELVSRLTGSDAASVKVVSDISQLIEQLRALRSLVEETFMVLMELMPSGQTEFRFTSCIEKTREWQQYLRLVDSMMALLPNFDIPRANLAKAAESESDEELAGRLFDANGFFEELIGHVLTLCNLAGMSPDYVSWIAKRTPSDRRFISVHRTPIDIARILSDTLFETKSTVILTSATLSVQGKFEYTKSRLGLEAADSDGRLAEISVSSPFRYEDQALLCVPKDVPELSKMSNDEAAVWLSDSLYQLAKASGGRTLALFTSHAMLRATATAIREPLQSAGLELFAQGLDGSRTRILDAFRQNPASVLLGAQSFWEGIDLPGDQLTTLCIIRLPFAPPTHPVTEARHERLEAEGQSAFWQASLPEAVVRFRQGFGRLIRTQKDRGVVVVFDKRIVTSKYGTTFVKSLPGVKLLVDNERAVVQRVREFLSEKRG